MQCTSLNPHINLYLNCIRLPKPTTITMEIETCEANPKIISDPEANDPPAAVAGAVDHRGHPASTSATGGWTSALFIIGVEVAERFAYYGVLSNLITYLTGPMGESTAAAAASVNTWSGTASMLPIAGAIAADSWLGRYRAITIASLLYVLALGMLTVSSMAPALRPPKCSTTKLCHPSRFQTFFFYLSLYLVALAQGGHKPCVQAFGADQFDPAIARERASRASFFNWWYFSMCAGVLVAILVLSYVQDNIGWGLGFGIPCVVMVVALAVFLLGTRTYRFHAVGGKSPFVRIGKAFVALATSRRRQTNCPASENACSGSSHSPAEKHNIERIEEEAKAVLRLIPIWASCLIFAIVSAQISTFFTKQGSTLDRNLGRNFQVPPAALQSLVSVSIVLFIPIYDRIIVPATKKLANNPRGITMLQRIGTGLAFSVVTMVAAALVEMKRLRTARDSGLTHRGSIPMSIWWMIPQYVLCGMSDVFTIVGLQEFFYDQAPEEMRSIGLALFLSIFGVGNFLSSALVSIIDRVTGNGGGSWFSKDLHEGHLDYFYWLLAGLGAFGMAAFFFSARSYVYKK